MNQHTPDFKRTALFTLLPLGAFGLFLVGATIGATFLFIPPGAHIYLFWGLSTLFASCTLLTAWMALSETQKIKKNLEDLARDAQNTALLFDQAPSTRSTHPFAIIRASLKLVQQSCAQDQASRREQEELGSLEAMIQRALVMADNEDDILDITQRTFAKISPDTPIEFLLADNDQKQLHRRVEHRFEGSRGCNVENRHDCPALRQGQALYFHSSDELSACPRLRKRGEHPLSAICAPVRIMGKNSGVLHTTTPVETPFPAHRQMQLESMASRMGTHMGTLRTLEISRRQAQFDPKTGFFSTEGFQEESAQILRKRNEQEHTLILVHFDARNLPPNESGAVQHALHLFSEALHQGRQPGDILGHNAHNELVALLPNSTTEDAQKTFDAFDAVLEELAETPGGELLDVHFGFASYPHNGNTVGDLLHTAGAMVNSMMPNSTQETLLH